MVPSYNTLILTGVRPVNPTHVLGFGRIYDQGQVVHDQVPLGMSRTLGEQRREIGGEVLGGARGTEAVEDLPGDHAEGGDEG